MSDEEKKLAFVAFCLERYKAMKELSAENVAETFLQYGVEKYLYEEYDVLHTMGDADIVSDIDRFIKVREGLA